MIDYYGGAFGINLLAYAHGSAVYRACFPGIISVCLFLGYNAYSPDTDSLGHPYAVGVLVSSISFLIIFRANHGYQRYWEACGAIHQMMSKYLDASVHAGVYHMQCKHYDSIKPPNYFDNHELNGLGLTRDREVKEKSIPLSQSTALSSVSSLPTNSTTKASAIAGEISPIRSATERSINHVVKNNINTARDAPKLQTNTLTNQSSEHLLGKPRLDGGWDSQMFAHHKISDEYATPSLYLQELCHLSSLLVAVAFSTLRNDIEFRESPLGTYNPNSDPVDWPPVNPNDLSKEDRRKFSPRFSVLKNIRHWFGFDRTLSNRAKYYAARPMQVLGGVSDAELHMLRRAKGSSAKVTLAWAWLSEYMIREHLAGSMGNVGPPIVSRCIQFLSDGSIFYNHARKIMFIPFPFPHAQLSAVFITTIVATVPFMMEQYAGTVHKWIGAVLTFLTVVCLVGLHEVARELENPFRNMPNDLPLCTLLAMYNEALITMYFGFHPDAFYDPSEFRKRTRFEDTRHDKENVLKEQASACGMLASQQASLSNVKCNNSTNEIETSYRNRNEDMAKTLSPLSVEK
eukprot:CAMPEP_0194363226 /NCGR_PEP_ID=MMETSP0174-20130528/11089_1 /TAXON_ID=216777 /ORGANISM="Proboscia alata, Strain PI-D3" /LENGTH=571 /DNA_ID=CAMNT_0039136577 /DNA_START=31 /DNA_END=1746 /DNA_ORIENTATION=-